MTKPVDNISKNMLKHANKPRNQVRVPEYEVKDDAWIKSLLKRGSFGSLGTAHNNQPYINTMLYVYDERENAIHFHTAQIGRTRANIELNPQVCFTVVEMGRIIPNEEAVEFSVEYNSVVVFGAASVILAESDAHAALQMLMDKYAPHLRPGEHYNPIQSKDIKRTSVYKLVIKDWSAKQQYESQDYPGAFRYTPNK